MAGFEESRLERLPAWDAMQVAVTAGYGSLLAGNLDRAASLADVAADLEGKHGQWTARLIAMRLRAVPRFLMSADFDGFADYWRKDLEYTEEQSLNVGWLAAIGFDIAGMAAFWKGRWEEALEYYERALVTDDWDGLTWGGGWPFIFLLTAYSAPDFAVELLRRRADRLPRPDGQNVLGQWAALAPVVEGLIVLGERERAAALHSAARYHIDDGAVLSVPYGNRLVETVAGMAATAGRDYEAAERHFETALQQAHDLPHRFEQPEVRRWHAWMLLDRDGPGDREKARELLNEAIDLYREIGMPKHLELAEELLSEAEDR